MPDPSETRISWWRLALLTVVGWQASVPLRDSDWGLFGGITFGVHELGHLVFMLTGNEFLTVAGGSLLQLLVPLGAVWLMRERGDALGVAVAVMLGVPVGMVAGFVGGRTDAVISRLTDAMLACPFLILAIALAAFLGPALVNAMIAIGISAMPIFVRVARGATLNTAAEDYIEAARAVGNGRARILAVHILPNILPPVLVQASLTIAGAIIAEASLSFLGLGQQPPAPSWGSMLNAAQRFLGQAPWLSIFPGLSIFVVVLGFNLLGDGLRDALDPRRG